MINTGRGIFLGNYYLELDWGMYPFYPVEWRGIIFVDIWVSKR